MRRRRLWVTHGQLAEALTRERHCQEHELMELAVALHVLERELRELTERVEHLEMIYG